MTDASALERRLIELAAHGAARCGAGFGQYPIGVLYALQQLAPLADTPAVRATIAAFEERLSR